VATSTRCAAPLRKLIVRLNNNAGVPPVTCAVATFLMSFALDVAAELRIPRRWGASPSKASRACVRAHIVIFNSVLALLFVSLIVN
jgi:hypothetical protein